MPAAHNPVTIPARLALRNSRAGKDIEKLRKALWSVIDKIAAHILAQAEVDADLLRCANSLAQLSPAFLKAVEVGEIEGRLQLLEYESGATE